MAKPYPVEGVISTVHLKDGTKKEVRNVSFLSYGIQYVEGASPNSTSVFYPYEMIEKIISMRRVVT